MGSRRAGRRGGRAGAALVARLSRAALVAGALLAGSGVALGAFGAHGLQGVLGPNELGWWHTAVQYQMWHGLGLILISALPVGRVRAIAALLGGGVLLFSGSLYAMALTGLSWLGAVTPLGGIAMIAGWLMLAWEGRPFTRT